MLFSCSQVVTNQYLFVFFFAENKYDFHPASVNLMAETIKLVFCLVMSVRVVIRGEPGVSAFNRPPHQLKQSCIFEPLFLYSHFVNLNRLEQIV